MCPWLGGATHCAKAMTQAPLTHTHLVHLCPFPSTPRCLYIPYEDRSDWEQLTTQVATAVSNFLLCTPLHQVLLHRTRCISPCNALLTHLSSTIIHSSHGPAMMCLTGHAAASAAASKLARRPPWGGPVASIRRCILPRDPRCCCCASHHGCGRVVWMLPRSAAGRLERRPRAAGQVGAVRVMVHESMTRQCMWSVGDELPAAANYPGHRISISFLVLYH